MKRVAELPVGIIIPLLVQTRRSLLVVGDTFVRTSSVLSFSRYPYSVHAKSTIMGPVSLARLSSPTLWSLLVCAYSKTAPLPVLSVVISS